MPLTARQKMHSLYLYADKVEEYMLNLQDTTILAKWIWDSYLKTGETESLQKGICSPTIFLSAKSRRVASR